MKITPFPEQKLTSATWALLLACYLIPLLNLLLLSSLWFITPFFAALFFLRPSRNYLIRFHFLQSLLCFLIFTTIVILLIIFLTIVGNNTPLQVIGTLLFDGLVLLYILLTLTTLVLFGLRRSLHLPLIGKFAERFATRTIKTTQEVEENVN